MTSGHPANEFEFDVHVSADDAAWAAATNSAPTGSVAVSVTTTVSGQPPATVSTDCGQLDGTGDDVQCEIAPVGGQGDSSQYLAAFEYSGDVSFKASAYQMELDGCCFLTTPSPPPPPTSPAPPVVPSPPLPPTSPAPPVVPPSTKLNLPAEVSVGSIRLLPLTSGTNYSVDSATTHQACSISGEVLSFKNLGLCVVDGGGTRDSVLVSPSGVGVQTSSVTGKHQKPAKLGVTIEPMSSFAYDSYSMSISWGDGKHSTAVAKRGAHGRFTISTSHKYVNKGRYTVRFTITDQFGYSWNSTVHAKIS
jgi:hypothetical protein